MLKLMAIIMIGMLVSMVGTILGIVFLMGLINYVCGKGDRNEDQVQEV